MTSRVVAMAALMAGVAGCVTVCASRWDKPQTTYQQFQMDWYACQTTPHVNACMAAHEYVNNPDGEFRRP